ncbi:tRNA (N6-threonylcarbamoyladenosine(37)-N6)-methyltransferase TrmO [Bdellovibrionales bacterium]|nr:tRNA (N6-threonylcarbamoyladenosine(37)-N6)-methyltransferase TrmO [Bdellovibrionales bacterium]
MKKESFSPIGYIHVNETYPAEAPRQPIYSNSDGGYIELNPESEYEQALLGLNEFSHIWVIFQFHKNSNWKPLVQPPRSNVGKRGLFATRAPYRPNSLGLSAVEFTKISGRRVYFKNHDFLNGTPVFDIKPYIPLYDSLPEASMGWLEAQQPYEILWEDHPSHHSCWLKERGLNLESVIHSQLSHDPSDSKRKRLTQIEKDSFELAFRTWRILYEVQDFEKKVTIRQIKSGYSQEELTDSLDPYKDKELHRQFCNS